MLNEWDRKLLAQHKTRYEFLVSGRHQPQSQNEKHFVKTFRFNLMPITQHEIAYARYLEERRNKNFEETKLKQDEKNPSAIEAIIDEVDTQILGAEERGDKDFVVVASKYRSHMQAEQPDKDDQIASAFVWLNYLTESSLSKSLERWSADTFNTLSNEYTKAIDGSFVDGLKAGADYVSPPMHRLVEAGHTLPDAFEKARAALEQDTTIQELYGTASALLSDMSSVVGLPMFIMSKETAEGIKNLVGELGIDEKKFADLLSYNTIEVIGSVIPALALMFGWNSKDAQKFGELVGALGITAAFAGNPLGLIVAMVGLARSFHKAKSQSVTTIGWFKSIGKGGLLSSIVIASASVIGSSIWLVAISSLIIAQVLTTKGISVNWALIGKTILLKINAAKKS